jgi:3-oxoacyl-[acyl-carrier protein] reductase
MDLHLIGKRALITGSSRGLGFATARGLAMEGVNVAINGRKPSELEKSAKNLSDEFSVDVLPIVGDVSETSVPARLVDQVVSTWGGIDILVTNAGGPPSGAFESFDDDAWQKAINGTLFSHIRLIRAALPFLRQSKDANVLTITSYFVKQPVPNMVLSNSIRAATIGLTKTLALELGNQGIRFNSILPAWTATDRTLELDTLRAQLNKTTLEEERKRKGKDSALGRIGTPEEFANAAVFLVSPAASYITGVMLTVDGGLYKGTF